MKNTKLRQMTQGKRSKQKGVTVVGALIAIVIGGIITAGLYELYANWEKTNKTEQAVGIINKAFDNLPDLKQAFGTYNGLNNTVVYNSMEIVLENTKSPVADAFTTPFSTDGLTFSSVDSATLISGRVLTAVNQFAQIEMHDVTDELCLDIVTDVFDRALEIQVGTTRVADVGAAATQCAAVSQTTDLVFISN